MFNNDVTRNYNNQDATSEILLMLVGAFLLGCLLCWLLKKLFSDSNDNTVQALNSSNMSSQNYKKTLDSPKAEETKYIPQTTGEVRVIRNNDERAYSKAKIDELTKITGISPEVQTILKRHTS